MGTVWIIYNLGDREYAHKQVNRTFKLDKAKKKDTGISASLNSSYSERNEKNL